MAALYQSESTTAWASSTGVTITKPSGVVENDVMIAQWVYLGSTTNPSVPSGWTEVGSEIATSNSLRMRVFQKVAGGSEPANYTWSNDNTLTMAGSIIRTDGTADPSLVALVTDDGTDDNTDSPSFTGGITPSKADSLLVFLYAFEQAGAGTPNAGSYALTTDDITWTERVQDEDGTNCIAVATGNRTETTATGAFSASTGLGNGTADNAGRLIAIAPIVNGSATPAVVDMTASIQAPTATGDGNVSPAVQNLTASIQAPTVTGGTAKWSNTSKTDTSPTITNTPKS